MTRHRLVMLGLTMQLAWLCPSPAAAQSAAPAPSAQAAQAAESSTSRLWITVGTAFATVRGDCQTCEEDFPYRHAAGFIANAGRRVNDRMDVGAEVFWMPTDTEDGEIRTTHIDAIAQFRPWASKGFFLKGGAGMAFVRNWVDAIGPEAINQKALSVVIGTGWAFRPYERVGFQVFGAQHVGALGDLQTAEHAVEDVVGNFWSLGMSLVIR
jgi:hypothetical protein